MVAAFTACWLTILVVGLAVEAVALWRRASGDTLSEHVWWLRARTWGRPLLYAAWGWLTWHFVVEEATDPHRARWWDDYTVIGCCALLGAVLAVRLRRRAAREPS